MSQTARTRALYSNDCPACDSELCTCSDYAVQSDLPIIFDDPNKIDLAE